MMMIFSFACLYDCIECVKDFKLSVQQNGVVSNTVVKPVSLFYYRPNDTAHKKIY